MDTSRLARATRRLLSLLRGSTHALAEGEARMWTARHGHTTR